MLVFPFKASHDEFVSHGQLILDMILYEEWS